MTQPERILELVHFQITRKCNLHCWFCGQWGEHGAFAGKTGQELSLKEWLAVADELEALGRRTGRYPSIILWGGEPAVSPLFEPLAETLAKRGFPLGLVTNGTLLGRHVSLCREAFRQIYVSLDGTPRLHNAVRGPGVYERVADNLALLRGGRAKITLMTVMTAEARGCLKEILDGFKLLEPDEVLLQERISLSPEEAKAYGFWLREVFSQPAEDIGSWVSGKEEEPASHRWYEEWLAKNPYPFSVRHLPHGDQAFRSFCLSPWRHLHVSWDGSVGFCTDFTDFRLGSVRSASLTELFSSDRAQAFRGSVREGRCAACQHCSWKNSETFGLGT